MKNKVKTTLLVAATVALAVIAILAAWRLYEQRREAIAPTAPKPVPAADNPSAACTLPFSLVPAGGGTPPGAGAPAASPSPVVSPSPSPPVGGPSPSPSPSPTASPKPSPTASPAAGAQTSPSPGATAKATTQAQTTKSPAASPSLPVAGHAFPTILAAGGGILLLILGVLLAF